MFKIGWCFSKYVFTIHSWKTHTVDYCFVSGSYAQIYDSLTVQMIYTVFDAPKMYLFNISLHQSTWINIFRAKYSYYVTIYTNAQRFFNFTILHMTILLYHVRLRYFLAQPWTISAEIVLEETSTTIKFIITVFNCTLKCCFFDV